MGQKLELEEIAPNIYRVKKCNTRRTGRISEYIGSEIHCESEEDLVEKIYEQLRMSYQPPLKNRLRKKILSTAGEIAEELTNRKE